MKEPLVPANPEPGPAGQLLIYRDGALNLQVRLDGQTVWLTQRTRIGLARPSPPPPTVETAHEAVKGCSHGEEDAVAYRDVREEHVVTVQMNLVPSILRDRSESGL